MKRIVCLIAALTLLLALPAVRIQAWAERFGSEWRYTNRRIPLLKP